MFGDDEYHVSIKKYNEVIEELNELRNVSKENEKLKVEISILETKVKQLTDYKKLAEYTFGLINKEGN